MAPTFIQTAFVAALFASSWITNSTARSSLAHRHVHNHIQKRELPVPGNLPDPWTYQGCYTDAVGSRTLSSAFYGDGVAMTGGACIAYCTQLGYNYAGTEYASECFCGNELSIQSTLAAPEDCNMGCTGDATTQCGGPNRLTVFWNGQAPPSLPREISQTNEWNSLGCYTDHGIANRTLTTIMPTTGGQSALTVELCTSACQDAGFTLAGIEYGSECFCGNRIANSGALAPDGSAGCNMGCNGNKTQKCGGSNRLNLYGYNGTRANGWGYQGCYIDGAQGRILTKQQPDSSSMTIESCISTCKSLGYAGAGLEYSFQCFCDSYLYNGAALTSDSDCNMPCSGNPDQKCGAGGRMSIYANSTLSVFQPPAVQKTNLPGNWEYQGCLYDLDIPRSLKYQLILDKNNTAENCLSQCSKFGYGAGGMEYGRECWCGDEATVKALNRQFFPESDCNMPCTGNETTICGAGNRISYYTWAGTPLNSWDFPTGSAAGEYQFLIGGVVIPLITTLAINGKVTFVEKFGTGAVNTTGAYELDLAQISNFTGAWRPMHVKSDVFCAAGLTLPDKAGRQINVGGWANDDTFGVRLYTPDGSPGVWGVNDWEEDKSLVRLQAGRWYPTSMIMANGSILVVGGQVGANGAAVPSLEILPKPAGGFVQYCDWLARTDPNNLYPYLAVLPSGGVFVAYYNEARVLDPVSLETVKTIENIPAAVNDFNGGRTYPFEGTAVLMPQYAPYSDPLTIMICGGSTPGPEVALDNCVSVSPEEADPKWTIERMPSSRVISCMTALPDGTYLILNGGQQGRAGFGLTVNPNRNAVLYDPRKPVNQRMSVMANTTVDRLYHSEAILLQDGRVLVSGSDPQDVRFEQEYRVEVFVPPYLLSGAVQPEFTIANNKTSFDYGETIVLDVRLYQGTASDVKVSLMGADSSTHGNSMGQRTIFPAVSCSGTTCTVTTPPNANVSPPGWHQLFLLDGPTPSNSQWIRIGGDPAGLGNWPDATGFTVPGV